MEAGTAPDTRHATTFRLTSVTLAHPDVAAEDRARFSLTASRAPAVLRRIRQEGIDAFVMTTCLRTEVATSGCERALGRVLEILFPDQPMPVGAVFRSDRDAVRHLYRVAAGLESPIVGEPEVLGQFRAALDASRKAEVAGGLFERALQSAVATGKMARRRMGSVGRGSVALAAAKVAQSADHVALFGAGAMARATAEALMEVPESPKISVYARRPHEVAFPADELLPMTNAPEALSEVPAVISATAAKRDLFDPDVLAHALGQRDAPLLLIDLAMPPDFSPSGANGLLTYLNVDDVAMLAQRGAGTAVVDAFVEQAASETWARLSNHHQVGPVIQAILEEAHRAVAEEVARFAKRTSGGDSDLAVMSQLATTVAHRVLHRPLSYLSGAERGAEAAPILADVFGVNVDG